MTPFARTARPEDDRTGLPRGGWLGRLLRTASLGAALAGSLLTAHAAPPAPVACPAPLVAPTPDQEAAARRDARDHGFLWRIVRDGRTSWLYGTIHIGRYEWSQPGPQVREAMQGSRVLALELDPTDPSMQGRLQTVMAPTADRALPPAVKQRLLAQMRKACIPEGLADVMAPELMGMALTVMSARRDGLAPDYGVDLTLAKAARASGQRIVSLESPELQMASLLSTDRTELAASMDKMLGDLERDDARPLLLRVATTWADGNEADLVRYRDWCDCVDTPRERAVLKRLLEDRNPGLADSIDRLHAGGDTVFAAVGALHMVGPDGVPALLARRGYDVTRIAFTP